MQLKVAKTNVMKHAAMKSIGERVHKKPSYKNSDNADSHERNEENED